MRLAGLLHDVGKSGIGRRDRSKPGPLTTTSGSRCATTRELGAALLKDAGLDEIRDGSSATTSAPTAPATRAGWRRRDPPRSAHPRRGGRLRGDDQRPRVPALDRPLAGAEELRRNAGRSSTRSWWTAFLRVRRRDEPGRGLARASVGGASRARTGDLRAASATLSQLSYSPELVVARPILPPVGSDAWLFRKRPVADRVAARRGPPGYAVSSTSSVRHLAPQRLEAVVVARGGGEDVHDAVEVVHQDPARLGRALDALRERAPASRASAPGGCRPAIALVWRSVLPVQITRKSV